MEVGTPRAATCGAGDSATPGRVAARFAASGAAAAVPAPPPKPVNSSIKRGVGRVRALDLTADHALAQQQHAVGQLGDEVEVLLHHHHGDAAPAVEVAQQLDDPVDDRRLDSLRRLVEQDQLGLGDEAAGDGEKLLLAAGQRAAVPVHEGLQHRELDEDPPDRLLLIVVVVGDPHADVVAHAQVQGRCPALAARSRCRA